MKIGIVTSTFFPQIGGVEMVVHYLAKGLVKQGHQVTVIAPKPRRDQRTFRSNYLIRRYVHSLDIICDYRLDQ